MPGLLNNVWWATSSTLQNPDYFTRQVKHSTLKVLTFGFTIWACSSATTYLHTNQDLLWSGTFASAIPSAWRACPLFQTLLSWPLSVLHQIPSDVFSSLLCLPPCFRRSNQLLDVFLSLLKKTALEFLEPALLTAGRRASDWEFV